MTTLLGLASLVIALLTFTSPTTFASDLDHLPKAFAYKDGKAVFVDFSTADYSVDYDLNSKTVSSVATIRFNAPEAGYPVFDSGETPTLVQLDDATTASDLVATPDSATKVRVVGKVAGIGEHTLKIATPIKQLVTFLDNKAGVKSAYWMTDLTDRSYLEKYLPANFIFDRVKMTFRLHFIGSTVEQRIYTNGVVAAKSVTNLADQRFTIEFPEGYNSTCTFFHTTPVGAMKEITATFTSMNGKAVPFLLYAGPTTANDTMVSYRDQALSLLAGMENDLGAWPHPSVTIYIAGSGGMEYSGATMTSPGALSHELSHSYFARAVLPADGNAGWIDEAFAVWRTSGFTEVSSLLGASRMAAHQYYTRTTDTAAYTFGAEFLGYLNFKLKSQGGLKPYLRMLVQDHAFQPITTDEFSSMLGKFYGTSFDGDFRKYVYGSSTQTESFKRDLHPQYTPEELKSLL
ncbi:MAG: hypothetical protein JST80_13195 [Bdellovibrionales bacterium]|nr:hypothetical protein [Bdellovibrionales bacterium]